MALLVYQTGNSQVDNLNLLGFAIQYILWFYVSVHDFRLFVEVVQTFEYLFANVDYFVHLKGRQRAVWLPLLQIFVQVFVINLLNYQIEFIVGLA